MPRPATCRRSWLRPTPWASAAVAAKRHASATAMVTDRACVRPLGARCRNVDTGVIEGSLRAQTVPALP